MFDLSALVPVTRWACPSCTTTDVTRQAGPHTRFHSCPALGLTAPLVAEGERVKVTVNRPDDYVRGELVQTDTDGRPVMNVVTEHWDGRTDCAVYAPTATQE